MLEVKKLTQKYRFGVPAFTNLSFHANVGEILCVLGMEESGKTSLLQTLCGVNKAHSGNIFIDGNDYTTKPIKDRDFFLLQERYGFFSHKTLFANLAYPLRIRKVPEDIIQEKVNALAKKYGYENQLNAKICKLDRDTRITAAVSRAELRSCRVYLFDNPFKDASYREKLFDTFLPLFDELKKSAHVIYATDSVREAETLSSSTLILRYGYSQGFGEITALKSLPFSRYVFSLLHNTAEEEQGILQKDANELYLQTDTARYTLSEKGLLNEIFIGKKVIVCKDTDDIWIFDPASEKIIYFEKIN